MDHTDVGECEAGTDRPQGPSRKGNPTMNAVSKQQAGPPAARPRRRGKALRISLLALAAVFVLLAGFFLAYTADFSRATPTALAALTSDASVKVVEVPSGYAFVPVGASRGIGLVVYPGGKVDEKAYAPLCRSLAAEGWPVALVRMPFKLAVFGIGLGKDGISDLETALTVAGQPLPSRYVATGHSLGGVMAARYALTDAARFAGVALWASYADQDLRPAGFSALTVYGSEDRVLNLDALEKARVNLPADATTVVVPGGNHAGFGDYGAQKGDGTASVTGERQRAAVVAAMTPFLEDLETAKGGQG